MVAAEAGGFEREVVSHRTNNLGGNTQIGAIWMWEIFNICYGLPPEVVFHCTNNLGGRPLQILKTSRIQIALIRVLPPRLLVQWKTTSGSTPLSLCRRRYHSPPASRPLLPIHLTTSPTHMRWIRAIDSHKRGPRGVTTKIETRAAYAGS